MELLFLIMLGFAAKSSWDYAQKKMGESRTAKVAEIKKTYRKGEIPKHKLKAASRRHDAGWWAGEIRHGFPVMRRGWQAGWIAQRTEAERHRARVEEARTAHAEEQAFVLSRLPEHQERRAEAQKTRDEILTALKGQPDEAKGSRKAVRQAADEVAAKRAEKQAATGAAPMPSDTVDVKPAPEPGPYGHSLPTCSVCGQPLRAHPHDGKDHLACAPAEKPAPAPTRRIDGKPETEADRKFLALRESGYEGPVDQDGNAAPDEMADAARNPQPIPPSPPTGGDTVTATAEITYDQQMAQAQQMLTEAEHELATIQASRIGNAVEAMGAMLVDPGNLSRAAEVDEALREREKAAQRTVDAVTAFRDGLRRDHGQVNEAHQNAPAGGAERAFYQG